MGDTELDDPPSPERLRMAAETLDAVRARGRQLAFAIAEAAGASGASSPARKADN
jgi:hypothetical protein